MIKTEIRDVTSFSQRLLVPRGASKTFTFYFNTFNPFSSGAYFMKNLSTPLSYNEIGMDIEDPFSDFYYITGEACARCENRYLEDEAYELIEEEYSYLEDEAYELTKGGYTDAVCHAFNTWSTNEYNYKKMELPRRKFLGEM